MSGRLLVVEDDADVADFLVRGLREEGYAVERSADGRDAPHRLRTEDWDAVLLDWRLPAVDGLSALREYRRGGGAAPVLVLTARDAVADRVRGLDGGADDYLTKPFAFEELLARLRALMRRGRPAEAAEPVLAFADLRVDLLTRRATRAGRPLSLTAKEEALLIFFLRHPGRVLTRTRIYGAVWDDRYDGLSNTLEVLVMELRRKREAGGAARLIHTLRHRGYLFGEPPAP